MSETTRPSLLIRIGNFDDQQAWTEFFELYSPLLYSYALQRGLSHEDAEDIRASCYESIVNHIRSFEYSSDKSGFRAWLRTMVNRRVIDLKRKKRPDFANSHELKNLADPTMETDQLWEQNWRSHHLRYCVALVGKRVQRRSFEAFKLLTEEQLSPQQVAARLDMSLNQVHKIKSRFLKLVRNEMNQFEFTD